MRTNSNVIASFTSLVLVITAFMLLANSAFAASLTIKGKIKDSSNGNASGASVSVTCNGATLHTTSAHNGNFEVIFPDGVCNSGDSVSVTASLNGETGSAVQNALPNTTNFGNINLAAIAVPEFGMITGLVAAAGSGLAYMKMRKGFNSSS